MKDRVNRTYSAYLNCCIALKESRIRRRLRGLMAAISFVNVLDWTHLHCKRRNYQAITSQLWGEENSNCRVFVRIPSVWPRWSQHAWNKLLGFDNVFDLVRPLAFKNTTKYTSDKLEKYRINSMQNRPTRTSKELWISGHRHQPFRERLFHIDLLFDPMQLQVTM